jgi:DNA-binding LytR/AlgR family response regulator
MKNERKIIIETLDLKEESFKRIHVGSRTHLLPKDIVMVSADLNYSYIHLNNGRRITVSTNIQKLEERCLPFLNMVRVHRSYMINTRYLQYLEGSCAKLTHNLECTISRRKMPNLMMIIQTE